MQKTEHIVIDTDAGSTVGLQTLKPILGALAWNGFNIKFHTAYQLVLIAATKDTPLYEEICLIASLPGGEEAKWLVENADIVVKEDLVLVDDYPCGKKWARDPRFLYYMHERAYVAFGKPMWKWLIDSALMGYSFAIKDLSHAIFTSEEHLIPHPRPDVENFINDAEMTKIRALCLDWNTEPRKEPVNYAEKRKFFSALKRRVYQGGCALSIPFLSEFCGSNNDRIGSVFWTAASFASNQFCRWYENEDEALFLNANNFGGDRNPGSVLHAATTFVTLEKYQLAKCMFEMRKLVPMGKKTERKFMEFIQFRGLTLEGMLKWYSDTNDRARLAIDAWTIISRRFGVVKDIRRLIGNMLWADRHDWRF